MCFCTIQSIYMVLCICIYIYIYDIHNMYVYFTFKMTGELPRSPSSPGVGAEVGRDRDREPCEHQESSDFGHRGQGRRRSRSSRQSSRSRSRSRRRICRRLSSHSSSPRRRRSRSSVSSTSPASASAARQCPRDRSRSPSARSPVELLSTEELRAGLAQRLGSVGLPPGRLYGGPRPKQVVRPSAPSPVGRITPGPKAKPKPKPNPFEHINLPPRPVRPWWHSCNIYICIYIYIGEVYMYMYIYIYKYV